MMIAMLKTGRTVKVDSVQDAQSLANEYGHRVILFTNEERYLGELIPRRADGSPVSTPYPLVRKVL
jgi:hypothetical protein